jgi:hypothetical protein
MGIVVADMVGVSAPRSLSAVLSCVDDIEEIRLARLLPLPPIQARLNLTASEHVVFERALKLRQNTGLSFWDSVLLELSAVPEAFRLLDVAMMHVSLRGQEFSLSRSEVNAGTLEHLCSEFRPDAASSLTLLSEVVRRDGSLGHLPMIDFHAPKSAANQHLVEAVAERLFPRGAILMDSGESYHAYGTQVVSQEEFRSFLGYAMLFIPIVDRAYVAHQLIENRCALRITAGGGKSQIPTVVAVLPGRQPG